MIRAFFDTSPDFNCLRIETTVGAQPFSELPGTAINVVDLADKDVPQNKTFRAAWVLERGTIAVDMDRARAITRDRLRAERALLLSQQDVEALKAIEAGDTAKLADIAAEKQRLRDITKLPDIDAAKSPADLEAITCR